LFDALRAQPGQLCSGEPIPGTSDRSLRRGLGVRLPGASPQNYGYRRTGVNRRSTVTRSKGVTVTRRSIREYLAAQRARYLRTSRVECHALLDEIIGARFGAAR